MQWRQRRQPPSLLLSTPPSSTPPTLPLRAASVCGAGAARDPALRGGGSGAGRRRGHHAAGLPDLRVRGESLAPHFVHSYTPPWPCAEGITRQDLRILERAVTAACVPFFHAPPGRPLA